MVRHAPLPIALIDPEAGSLCANSAFKELFGFDQAEISSLQDWLEHALPLEPNRNALLEAWDSVETRSQGEQISSEPTECTFTCRNGHEVHCEVFAFCLNGLLIAIFNHRLEPPSGEIIKSWENLSAVFEGMGDGVIVANAETGKFIAVNQTICEMLGYKRKELVGLTPKDIHPEETMERSLSQFQRFVRGEQKFGPESPMKRKDGSIFHADTTVTRIIQDGQPCVLGVFHDTTERRRAERALLEARQTAADIVENLSAGLLVYKRETGDRLILVDANPQGERLLNIRLADCRNQEFSEIWRTPAHLELKRELLSVRAGAPFRTEILETLGGAKSRILMVQAFSLPSERLAVSFEDMTAQRAAERAVLASEARFKQVAEILGEWIWETNPAGVFTYSNAVVESILGFSPGEIVGGMSLVDLLPVQGREQQLQTVRRSLAEGKPVNRLELVLRSKSSDPVHIHCTAEPLLDSSGGLTGYRGAVLDITAQKQLELHLLQTHRMESIGMLASGIAHDLKNVLGPILTSIGILKSYTENPKAARVLENIEASAERGANIIDQMLMFARGVEGEQRVEIQPKHLLKEIRKIVEGTFPKNIILKITTPPEVSPVSGDPSQLYQVLMNLCVLARDAMPGGGILSIALEEIDLGADRITQLPEAKPGPYVLITVAHTGSHAAAQPEPFFGDSGSGEGRGLGLSTVLTIVKSHGGWMDEEMRPGHGKFHLVYLPAVPSSDKRAGNVAAPEQGKGETVLLIDDEAAARAISGQVLESNGYRVLSASNGAEALMVFAKEHPKIAAVLTDLMMPVMDGGATIHALRKINPLVRIIAMSGSAPESVQIKVRMSGVRYFLEKPFTAENLLHTLRNALDDEIA